MKTLSCHFRLVLVGSLISVLSFVPLSPAQQTSTVIPTMVKFSGTLTDVSGKPLTVITGVTFLLYKDERGGAPLWMETQNVTPDKSGHYTVVLGSTTTQGLPTDLFASGEARWLGVQAQGQAEQPRVLLLSVPYALKAGDAQTVGGLPASAFVLAATAGGNVPVTSAADNAAATSAASASPLATSNVTTTGGTANAIPLFTTATNIQNSILTQTGTSVINVGGKMNLPATGTATSTGGKNSQPQDYVASAYNSSTKAAAAQTFQLQAEPAGNNTAAPSGTLNLLYGSGTTTPAETGFKISSKGLITFATGQAFPGTGTITKVTAGTDLTGGGSGGNVTLNLDTTKIPQLNVANTFTGKQTIKGDLSETGNITDTGNISATGSISGQTAAFTANNSTQVVNVTQKGAGIGLNSTAVAGTAINGSGSIGVNAEGTGSSGIGLQAGSSSGVGIFSSTATGIGIFSIAGTPNGVGSIEGYANSTATGANTPGVIGFSTTQNGVGTKGLWSTASTVGVGTQQTGVWGDASAGVGVTGTSDTNIAVSGRSAGSQGVWGESFGTGFSNGAGSDGVHGVSHTNQGSGVAGVNDATNGTGVYGSDTSGYGFVTDSHVSQGRAAGGWAKAMAFVDPANGNATNGIKWCFNSQIAGSQASTSPCGMGYTRVVNGAYLIDFGFQVSDRFVLVTPVYTGSTPTIGHTLTICYGPDGCLSHSATQVNVVVDNSSSAPDSAFYIVVF